LGFALQPCSAQKSNKPDNLASGREPLNERDNSFSTGRRHKLFSGGLFGKKKGFNHKKKISNPPAATKKNRKSFEKKRYTGKKRFFGLFGDKKSGGWGGKAFKKNGKEDKRLFKAPKNKSKERKRGLLKKNR
jgi:hypothetical protein